jgi:adenylate kinase family enzyme
MSLVSDLPARILLYGVTGSGKTTAARRLAGATGLPLVDVDEVCWEPGWVQVPAEEQRRRFAEICGRDAWVLDTAYGIWTDVALARAELVVALDYPRWVSLARLVRRTASRVLRGTEVCNGNRETLRRAVDDDSILRWHFRSFDSKRDRIRAWQADPAMPPVLRFTRPRDLEEWLAGLPAGAPR